MSEKDTISIQLVREALLQSCAPGAVTDEVLHTIAACGSPQQIADHIRERVAAADGLADTVCLYQPGPIPVEVLAGIVEELR